MTKSAIFPARPEPLTVPTVVQMLRDEAAAIEAGADTPLAFVVSICGSIAEWGLDTLPRRGSGSPDSTENERMLLHQLLGTVNALADIY